MNSDDSPQASPQSRWTSASMKGSVAVAFTGLTLSALNSQPAYFVSALLSIPFIIGCARLIGHVQARWFDAA